MTSVLVVDDNEMFRTLVKTILSDAGFDVTEACDGQEGWELLRERRFDIAVLDLNMPRLDGLALTKKIREHRKLGDLPIIMMTIRDLVEDQLAGYDRGADDYLTKPFDHGELLARVQALLRRA